MADDYKFLTMKEIIDTVPKHTLSFHERRTRANLIAAISVSSDEVKSSLDEACQRKRHRRDQACKDEVKKRRLDDEGSSNQTSPSVLQDLDLPPCFLKPVQEHVRQHCISQYLTRTGSAATELQTCMICAGEFFASELEVIAVDEIPHQELLSPAFPHHTQRLFSGMLLYNDAVHLQDSTLQGQACSKCMSMLRGCKRPPLSLSNGLWIGDIPAELSALTIPECLLVALHFPSAYIVKLFPKKKGAKFWDVASINSGIRGNVSTYRLNTSDIADMVNPKILPPHPALLASTIGVTIVGPRNFPQHSIPRILTVNRARVHEALQFLKQENPLYADISISQAHLHQLPENGVPDEIMDIIKHSEDMGALEKERDGYVAEDDDCEVEGEHHNHSILCILADFN